MALDGTVLQAGFVDLWDELGAAGGRWYVGLASMWFESVGEPGPGDGSHTEWRWFAPKELPPAEEMTRGTAKYLVGLRDQTQFTTLE